jgi:hypothetical protein
MSRVKKFRSYDHELNRFLLQLVLVLIGVGAVGASIMIGFVYWITK